jgi:hypothetical protein
LDILGWLDRINSMSRDEPTEEGNRLIARAQALNNKEKSIKFACQSRSKSVPKSATIREEFVNCNKPNCSRRLHGPYYYAYWKDPETKRLKKRYIGSHYYPSDKQKRDRRRNKSIGKGLSRFYNQQ